MSKTTTKTVARATPTPAEVATVTDALPEPVRRRGLSESTWRTLVNSIYPGAASESILMAVDYCIARKLDPLKRVVHIVPMSVKDAKTGAKAWRDVIMSGIAELRTTATRTGEYAGQDRSVFGPMQPIEQYKVGKTGFAVPEFCDVTIYRKVSGERVAFTATVFFDEAMGLTTDQQGNPVLNSMWSKRPRGQLEKCAEAAALRKAFPEELGGQIAAEEVLGGAVTTGVVGGSGSSASDRLVEQLKPKDEPAAAQPVSDMFDEDESRAMDAQLAEREHPHDES